jgi:hypothetical protein
MQPGCPHRVFLELQGTPGEGNPAYSSVSILATIAGCGAPVTVRRVDPRTVHRELTRSVLSAEEAGPPPPEDLIEQAAGGEAPR